MRVLQENIHKLGCVSENLLLSFSLLSYNLMYISDLRPDL